MKKMYLLAVLAMFLASSILITTVNAKVGDGVLYVYTDSARTIPALMNAQGQYLVEIGKTYYIRVMGISADEGFKLGDSITVKIGWTSTAGSETTFIYNVQVQQMDSTLYIDVEWTVPANAKVDTTSTVHYVLTGEYVASGLIKNIGHMLIIPETLLGTIGPVLAMFTGLGIVAVKKSRPSKVMNR